MTEHTKTSNRSLSLHRDPKTEPSNHETGMRSSFFRHVKRRWLVAGYRRSRQTIGPETSVTNYQSTLRNIPQEGGPHLYSGGSLKSRKKQELQLVK